MKVAHSFPVFATSWMVACQDSLSMEFSRQEYWSGLPFPSLKRMFKKDKKKIKLLATVVTDLQHNLKGIRTE